MFTQDELNIIDTIEKDLTTLGPNDWYAHEIRSRYPERDLHYLSVIVRDTLILSYT